jgi:hypothetical protein
MKPSNFHDLPASLREELLWDMDLDYDTYESSMADTVNILLHSTEIWGKNADIINEYWNNLSEDTFQAKVKGLIENQQQQVKALKKLVDKSK